MQSKNFILVALLLAATVSVSDAQHFHNGAILIGDAAFGYKSSDRNPNFPANGEAETYRWDFSPALGKVFGNHTIGGSLKWGQSAFRFYNITFDPITENRYSAGIFYRYTKYIAKTPIFFYGQLDAKYLGGYTTSGNRPAFDKFSGVDVNFFPAVGIYVSHRVALNFSVGGVGYQQVKSDEELTPGPPPVITSNTKSGMYANVGQAINLGVSVNLGKHGKSKKAVEVISTGEVIEDVE